MAEPCLKEGYPSVGAKEYIVYSENQTLTVGRVTAVTLSPAP